MSMKPTKAIEREAYRYFEKQRDNVQMRLEQAKQRTGCTVTELQNLERKLRYHDMVLFELRRWSGVPD